MQALAEWQIELAVVAEPYAVPPNKNNWLGDTASSVTIVGSYTTDSLPLSAHTKSEGFVVAHWGETAVVGMYFSPNRSLAQFETFLDRVGAVVGRLMPGPVLIMGDLNAKAKEWGSPKTDTRGEALIEWVHALGLTILNTVCSEQTCVRRYGGLIVDVTLVSAAVSRTVSGWRVETGSEALSDHLYIRFEISGRIVTAPPTHGESTPSPVRWALKRLDRDALVAASVVTAWPDTAGRDGVDVEEEAAWFRGAMSQICDVGMPRARRAPLRRGVVARDRRP